MVCFEAFTAIRQLWLLVVVALEVDLHRVFKVFDFLPLAENFFGGSNRLWCVNYSWNQAF